MAHHLVRPALAAAVLCAFAVTARASNALPEPSANAGKTGIYQCTTTHKGYNYYVCAPASYSPERPAGLYIFLILS